MITMEWMWGVGSHTMAGYDYKSHCSGTFSEKDSVKLPGAPAKTKLYLIFHLLFKCFISFLDTTAPVFKVFSEVSNSVKLAALSCF